MKKGFVVGLCVCVLLLSATTPCFADFKEYVRLSSHKLARGLTNIATGLLDIGYSIDTDVAEYGLYKGIPTGAIRGLYNGVGRMLVGAYEVVSFPIGYPRDFEPIMEPEFIFTRNDKNKQL